MAIKIKKKGDRPEGSEEEEEGTGSLPKPGAHLDGFERASFTAAAWVENNRQLVFGLIILIIVGVVAALLGMQYVRGQQGEASDRLSQGLAAYEIPVEGSAALEEFRAEEDAPELPQTFETDQERWEAVYESAAHTLADFDRGPIALSARMVQAAAALNLERYEEAAGHYQEVIDSAQADDELRSYAYMGLANSLASQGDVDGARQAWSDFKEHQPARQSYADFEIARLLERSGETDEARQQYQEFLDAYPQSPFRDEVERRLALL